MTAQPRPAPSDWLAATVIGAYVLSAAAAAYVFQYRALDAGGDGVFGLSFGFGPLVKSMVLEGHYAAPADGFFKPMPDPWMFTAHRMPAIPWFLAAVAWLWNSALLAAVLKAALVAPLIWSAWRALRRIVGVGPALAALCLVPAAFMPAMVNIGSSLQMEEGFLIPMMFFLFAHLLEQACDPSAAPSTRRAWALAIVNGTLYLTKASMWPLMLVNMVLFPVATRRARMAIPFAVAIAASVAIWGGHNRWNSGEFRLGNTWSSWCLYKGNNQHTASIYPEWTVDRMDYEGLIESPADFRDEWTYEEHNAKAASEFIRANPSQFIRLTLRRARVFFLSVLPYPTQPPDPPASLQSRLEWVDIACMSIFRAAFAMVLAASVVAWVSGPDSRWRWFRAPGTFLLLFVGAYSSAYVIGFGYQRHVLPIILPTLACAAAMVGGLAGARRVR